MSRSQYIYSVVLFFLLSSSFSLMGQELISGSLMHNGLERTYRIYVPAAYLSSTTDVPLVINFHGRTSTSNEQIVYGDFRPIADRENFLIVHPQGTLDDTGTTYWNAQFSPSGVDDIGFTSALITELSADYNIDQNRIYSTGMSNGGFMSYTLACELSDKIAAIASVTGSMTRDQINRTCNPQNITPIMEIHGTEDNVVPYEGTNLGLAGIEEVLNFWREKNNCSETEVLEVPDSNTTDDSTVEHELNTTCSENTSIELFKVIGGGHTWPGSAIDFGVTNYDINASEEIWRFFSQYNLDGKISALKETLPVEFKMTTDHSTIQLSFTSNELKDIRILSMNGEILTQRKTSNLESSISIAHLPAALYLVQVQTINKVSIQRFMKF